VDDEHYMQQLAAGNQSAMDALILRYHRALYGYVYRMTMNEHITQDIVQETFISLYRQAEKGNVPDQLKPWIYKIATNLCKDYWRKASTRKEIAVDQPVNESVPPQFVNYLTGRQRDSG
jgi:RNA polymerase sigma factor (sigma-70 family)